MTLQASGAISLANVQTEFGGSNPIGINEYYAAAAGVPASGTISLYNFYGKSASYWASEMMGRAVVLSRGNNTDSFNGTIITPGAGNSPVTFTILRYNDGANMSLDLYVGGSVTQTWTSAVIGNTSTNYTSTFGGSSLQFRSTIVDLDSGTYGNVSQNRVDVGAVPIVFSHEFDATGFD